MKPLKIWLVVAREDVGSVRGNKPIDRVICAATELETAERVKQALDAEYMAFLDWKTKYELNNPPHYIYQQRIGLPLDEKQRAASLKWRREADRALVTYAAKMMDPDATGQLYLKARNTEYDIVRTTDDPTARCSCELAKLADAITMDTDIDDDFVDPDCPLHGPP